MDVDLEREGDGFEPPQRGAAIAAEDVEELRAAHACAVGEMRERNSPLLGDAADVLRQPSVGIGHPATLGRSYFVGV